jgi:hypothetical protein
VSVRRGCRAAATNPPARPWMTWEGGSASHSFSTWFNLCPGTYATLTFAEREPPWALSASTSTPLIPRQPRCGVGGPPCRAAHHVARRANENPDVKVRAGQDIAPAPFACRPHTANEFSGRENAAATQA